MEEKIVKHQEPKLNEIRFTCHSVYLTRTFPIFFCPKLPSVQIPNQLLNPAHLVYKQSDDNTTIIAITHHLLEPKKEYKINH